MEERWAFRQARATVRAVLGRAIEAMRAAEEASLSADVAEAMAVRAVERSEDDVRALYTAIYERVVPRFAQHTFDALTRERRGPEADLWGRIVGVWLRERAGTLIRRVTQTLVSEVRRVLAEGVEAGEGIEKLRRRLERAVPGLSRRRARLIARTETLRASNIGAIEGARATGLRLQKEWLATDDDRTRDTHQAVGGQRRDLDAPFNVGGFPAMQPGDPDLPVRETANCRCAVAFIPID